MTDGVLVVVPARWGSSRFPGKLLEDLGGRPLVVRTAQQAVRMRTATRVVVATDDVRIAEAVRAADLECEMTAEHPTGTDRMAEVARRGTEATVVNIQGDEPLLDPADADAMVEALHNDPDAAVATIAHPFGPDDDWSNPNTVKVLVDRQSRALYFSRAGIPGVFPGTSNRAIRPKEVALRHIGLYAFRREALVQFTELPRGELEQIEGLEQLRALEHGLAITVVRTARGPIGVDTPEDLWRVRELWARRQADKE